MVIDRTNLPKEIEELAGLDLGLPYLERILPNPARFHWTTCSITSVWDPQTSTGGVGNN